MRVYLAGPMSGIPAFNIPAFDQAAYTLRGLGYDVVSPAEIDGDETRAVLMRSCGSHDDLPDGETYGFYLSRDVKILIDHGIEAVVTLPGWKDSKGVKVELAVAAAMGIPQVEYVDIVSNAVADNGVFTETFKALGLYDDDGRFVPYEENSERQRAETGAVKDNRSKVLLDLIPYEPLKGAAVVLGFGARKYKPNNWRLGLSWSQTWASLQRHLWAWKEGEDYDPESGLLHIDHAMCQLLFLSEYVHSQTGTDDRWSAKSDEEKKGESAA